MAIIMNRGSCELSMTSPKRAPEETSQQPSTKRKRTKSHDTADSESKTTDVKSFTKPHPNDVLSGRGGFVNNHSGNITFRRVVDANKKTYHSCPKKHKSLLAQSIVEAVHNQNPSGRFLMRDKKGNQWFEIEREKALQKTSQALREGADQFRTTFESMSETDVDGVGNNAFGSSAREKPSTIILKDCPHSAPQRVNNYDQIWSNNESSTQKISEATGVASNNNDEHTEWGNDFPSQIAVAETATYAKGKQKQKVGIYNEKGEALIVEIPFDEEINPAESKFDDSDAESCVSFNSSTVDDVDLCEGEHFLDIDGDGSILHAYPGISRRDDGEEVQVESKPYILDAYVYVPEGNERKKTKDAHSSNEVAPSALLEPLDKDTDSSGSSDLLSACKHLLRC